MPAIIRDGFHILDLGEIEFLRVESERLDACISYLKINPHLGVNIWKSSGKWSYYKLDNLDFLIKCPHVQSVRIQDDITDVSGLYHLKELKQLSVTKFKSKLDLTRFLHLIDFSGDWHNNIIGLDQCSKLEFLVLGSYNSKMKDLSNLSGLKSLSQLSLVRGNITSLHGIEDMPLVKMDLSYISTLTDISAVAKLSSIEVLRFDCCKKISSFNCISSLKRLKELGISACGEIASINFVSTLSELQLLSLVDSTVADGNLEALKKLDKLTHVGFYGMGKQKNCTPSVEEIKQWIIAKHGEKTAKVM
ncbi:MAG: hypothetical protein WCV67_05320 [Victivallaceae bacterium]|jgi:hypothetical protein